MLRMDRTEESGKLTGSGVCLMTNNWCHPGNVSLLTRCCSPNLQHVDILYRHFYLPREFSAVTVIPLYIPLQVDTDTALATLHDNIGIYHTKYLDGALIVVGDFIKANLEQVMPNFFQYITCPARGGNILDHCYTPFKDAY